MAVRKKTTKKTTTRKTVSKKSVAKRGPRGGKPKGTISENSYNFFGAAADKGMSKRFTKYYEAGREPKYKTAIQMRKVICEYLDDCYNRKAPATIGGLALSLGISRRQLARYSHKNASFRLLVKNAYDFVENNYEELLIHGKGSTPGVIFALKQMDWTDRHEVEHSGQVAIIATDEEDL